MLARGVVVSLLLDVEQTFVQFGPGQCMPQKTYGDFPGVVTSISAGSVSVNPMTGDYTYTPKHFASIDGHCINMTERGTGKVLRCEHCDWLFCYPTEDVGNIELRFLEAYAYGHAMTKDCDDPCPGGCEKPIGHVVFDSSDSKIPVNSFTGKLADGSKKRYGSGL